MNFSVDGSVGEFASFSESVVAVALESKCFRTSLSHFVSSGNNIRNFVASVRKRNTRGSRVRFAGALSAEFVVLVTIRNAFTGPDRRLGVERLWANSRREEGVCEGFEGESLIEFEKIAYSFIAFVVIFIVAV